MSDTFDHEGDAWDDLLNRHDDDRYYVGMSSRRTRPTAVACNRCGARCAWVHSGVRWRLLNDSDGKPHTCSQAASADEFEDVP